MRSSHSLRLCVLLCGCAVLFTACGQKRLFKRRDFYRQQADVAVNSVVLDKSTDPRWAIANLNVYMDPRSRYFDDFHPDAPPMPEDDPSAHTYMHRVYGMKGWKYWHRNGDRPELENPNWYEQLGGYVRMTEDGKVKLSIDSALSLAYINSPNYQSQLETLYLSALDVTAERFRLSTQFFGGIDAVYSHRGDLNPGGERNVVGVGRGGGVIGAAPGLRSNVPNVSGQVLELRRNLPTAGTAVVGFANSFVWQFAGTNSSATNSLLNFNLIQPLLRQAGRDIALEQLTIVERTMLSNMRAMQRYRQGFYTQLAIGQLGVSGPQRRGGFFGGTGLTGFTGQGSGGVGGVGDATFGGLRGAGGGGGGAAGVTTGFAGGGAGTVGGFIGLLQSLQQIRNSEDNLNRQLRTLSLLEANLQAGLIDLVQVDQFRQNIETERANLLQSRLNLQNTIETYLTGTLGLPPNLGVELDDDMIRQFQFVEPQLTDVQYNVADLQAEVGQLPTDVTLEQMQAALDKTKSIQEAVMERFQGVQGDLDRLEDVAPKREKRMAPEELTSFQAERALLKTQFGELQQRRALGDSRLQSLRNDLKEENKVATFRELVVSLSDLIKLTQELTLVQARARLEAVVVDPVDLSPDDAFLIAQNNRLDLMNNRAALVDTWRLIAFNADALQANLTVVLNGDVRTTQDNMFDFRGKTGNLTAGIQIDPPLTRLLERNNYRQSLVSYQQDRRQFIQFRDSIHFTMRQTLRQLSYLQTNLEIQRRAMAISIRRVDKTQEDLNAPVPSALPGQPPAQLGPTASLNLLTALSDLRTTQNNFMSVWLNYYATRMSLLRDLGIMVVDEDGRWVDLPIDETEMAEGEALPIPPAVPMEWLRDVLNEPGDAAPPAPAAPLPPPAALATPSAVIISYEQEEAARQ